MSNTMPVRRTSAQRVPVIFWTILLGWSAGARAQTDEIQVYDAGIAPVGIANLTAHNNFSPRAARSPEFPGGLVANHSLNGALEWAYGVTRWFEAGLYLPLYSVSSTGSVTFNGLKLRTLFVVPDAGARDFFYGINFEFSDNTKHWDPHTFTAEMRPIVGWRFGQVSIIVNPILDYTSDGVSGLDFAPATRIAFNAPRDWAVAVEEYADFGPLRKLLPGRQQSHQLFAVLDRSLGKLEMEAGIGFGLTQASDGLVLKLILSRDLSSR